MEKEADAISVWSCLDYFMSNPEKWRVYLLFITFQCITGVALLIYILTEILGYFTFKMMGELLYYFSILEEKDYERFHNMSSFAKIESRHFNSGSIMFALCMTIFFRLLSALYIRLKAGFEPLKNVESE